VLNELGVIIPIEQAHFNGVCEHFYDDCVFGDNTSTHHIVLDYELTLYLNLKDLPE
jgi:colanic acid biosynthesis protein WcaH